MRVLAFTWKDGIVCYAGRPAPSLPDSQTVPLILPKFVSQPPPTDSLNTAAVHHPEHISLLLQGQRESAYVSITAEQLRFVGGK